MNRILAFVLASVSAASAQEPPRGPGGPPPRPGVVQPVKGERITWYATLEQSRSEAKRMGRPILLVAAAPHCHQSPGVW